ncbi:hypothetical protein KSP40_PGU021829 [Platanthera guangdongensis]|uniref:Uncharacterized protein n=1 Tax=Platanthera guangdongensis TaxID=2320717 RepID=A0ABR2LH53_9ASPA
MKRVAPRPLVCTHPITQWGIQSGLVGKTKRDNWVGDSPPLLMLLLVRPCTAHKGVCGYVASNFAWANPNQTKTKGKYVPFTFTESIPDFCSDDSTIQMDVDLVHQDMGRFEFTLVGKMLERILTFFYLLAELTCA